MGMGNNGKNQVKVDYSKRKDYPNYGDSLIFDARGMLFEYANVYGLKLTSYYYKGSV